MEPSKPPTLKTSASVQASKNVENKGAAFSDGKQPPQQSAPHKRSLSSLVSSSKEPSGPKLEEEYPMASQVPLLQSFQQNLNSGNLDWPFSLKKLADSAKKSDKPPASDFISFSPKFSQEYLRQEDFAQQVLNRNLVIF